MIFRFVAALPASCSRASSSASTTSSKCALFVSRIVSTISALVRSYLLIRYLASRYREIASKNGGDSLVRVIDSPRHEALRAFVVEKRLKAGMRQIDVAKKLGRHQSYVSYVENGLKVIDVVELMRGGRDRVDPRDALERLSTPRVRLANGSEPVHTSPIGSPHIPLQLSAPFATAWRGKQLGGRTRCRTEGACTTY